MIGDEKLKQKLLLAWEICELYRQTGTSASMISKDTGVPLATVKRSLTTIGTRIDDYVRLLPKLGTKEELIKIQEEIADIVLQNKKYTKYSNREIPLAYSKQIEKINKLYTAQSDKVNLEDKVRFIDLRADGKSYREIGKITGFSVSTVHDNVKKSGSAKK